MKPLYYLNLGNSAIDPDKYDRRLRPLSHDMTHHSRPNAHVFQLSESSCTKWLLSIALLIFLIPSMSMAQIPGMGGEPEEEEPAPVVERAFAEGELETMPLGELRQLYETEIENLRKATKDITREGARYYHSTSDQSHVHQKKWRTLVAQSKKSYQRIKEASLILYLRTESPDQSLSRLAAMMNEKSYQDGRLSICSRVSPRLVAQFPDNDAIKLTRAKVAARTNDFASAAEFKTTNVTTIADLPAGEQAYFGRLEEKQQRWEAELAIRKQEAAADDLPRVEIETSKGKIVIELFENEAPYTVGNFVSLIQSGFYDDLIFHRVYRNYRAQGGLLTMNGVRSTGYQVVDESKSPKARNCFRGSVSMVSPVRTKGSSEFTINLTPEPFRETEFMDTVIGRVIEGMDVVESIAVTAKLDEDGQTDIYKDAKPDLILSTRVVRLRPNSKYEPKIVDE